MSRGSAGVVRYMRSCRPKRLPACRRCAADEGWVFCVGLLAPRGPCSVMWAEHLPVYLCLQQAATACVTRESQLMKTHKAVHSMCSLALCRGSRSPCPIYSILQNNLPHTTASIPCSCPDPVQRVAQSLPYQLNAAEQAALHHSLHSLSLPLPCAEGSAVPALPAQC